MDHLLQTVARAEMMSMLDGFSGYNQFEVENKDQHKTTFTTPWGTFTYHKMPFGLINVGATFQWGMDISFSNMKIIIIVVYLDDLTVFSKKRKHHIGDLKKVLQWCREHDISLNLKKSIFCVNEGKLLGHIVSQEGIKIDPECVEAIQRLSLPSNKIGVKSFTGQINFLQRFVPNFLEITKCIVDMMKGNAMFKWNDPGKWAFNDIKEAIANVLVLSHLDYKKYFMIYYYTSEHTLSAILM